MFTFVSDISTIRIAAYGASADESSAFESGMNGGLDGL